jgi:integrase
VDDRFRRYAGLAGLPANVCVHSLRWENCWARLQATGNNWERVQREIGWADIAMVARYARRRRKKEAGDPTANQVAARFAHM